MYKEVTNLYAAGQEYDMAIEFLKNVLQTNNDPATSSEIREQLKYLYVEKHIVSLQALVDKYIARYDGQIPESMDVFITMGFVNDIPEDPFGGKYVITDQGQVVNEPNNRFEHFQNLREHIPEEGVKVEPNKMHDPHVY